MRLDKELKYIWHKLPKWKQAFYKEQIRNLLKCIERDKNEG